MGGGYLAVGKKNWRVDDWCKGRVLNKYHKWNNQHITTVCELKKKLYHCTHVSQTVWVLPSEILCGSGCCAVEWTVDWNPGGGFCVVGQPAESENQWFTLLHVSFITQQ